MKRIIAMTFVLALLLIGCGQVNDSSGNISSAKVTTNKSMDNEIDTNELPSIVFIERTDQSDELGEIEPEELKKQNISPKTLGFYDKDGNYYTSSDPTVNAMDNKTLLIEYEAGNLTEQLLCYKSIDKNELSSQYAKLLDIYRNEKIEIEYPDELPDVQAASSTWYGYYLNQQGNLEYIAIHQNRNLTNLYTNNDVINEVYDWIIGTFNSTEDFE